MREVSDTFPQVANLWS